LVYNQRHTQRTQEHYKAVILRFARSLQIKTLRQLNRQHLESYINGLLSAGVKNRTINAHLTGLKSYCRWLAVNYDVPNHTAQITMLKEDPPKRSFIDHKQYLKLLDCCTDGEADAIRFLANSGVRASEAISLTWDCIDPQMKFLTVRHGKGRKSRVLPLNQVCRDILLKHQPQTQPVAHLDFLKSDRKQLYRACQTTGKRVGVKVSPHTLRRYFATELLARGVPLSLISKLLGHSSIKTTEKYINFTPLLWGITEVLNE